MQICRLRPVKLVLLMGAGNAETKISLQRLGISVIEPKPSDGLRLSPEKTHSDMLMLHLEEMRFILSKEQEDLNKQLEAFGFTPENA